MGRNRKKKQKVKEEQVQMLSHRDDDSEDDSVPDLVHDKLLENIKHFHGKPKIQPATRNEPSAEVSEFNVASGSGSKKRKLREEDLIRSIKKKKPKVAKKLESTKKIKTLPKPLETFHEKKIQREVGFENVAKHLSRWDDVVQSNRLADQLRFPLKNKKIEVYDHTDNDLFSSLPNPTPLEKEIAEVLNRSEIAQEHKEELEKSKFRLTLKELIEKRKMFAKVKAQASYKIVKAWRQNKIKSKKYHRLLKKEKVKKQIKDFEALQKTDPDAALKQLEQLEKGRAEERATLRHRNTGKWAKNQIIKATYNKESRVAISDQLSKHRELTQKLNQAEDSEPDTEPASDSENELSQNAMAKSNADNPWIGGGDGGNEYAKFVSNYKKYWEEKTTNEAASVPAAADTDEDDEEVTVVASATEKKASRNAAAKEQKKKKKKDKVQQQAAVAAPLDTPPKKEGKTKKRKAKKKQNRQKEYADSSDVGLEQAVEVEATRKETPRSVQVVDIENEAPDMVTVGDEHLDDDEDDSDVERRMTISEAFAEDDVVAEFEAEKEKLVEDAQPKEVNLSLPGWGSWTSESIRKRDEKRAAKRQPRITNKRLLFRIPKAPPRKDANKGNVIINEEKNSKLKEHMVSELPFPFKAVSDYEASIRAPIGRTWLPETAHQKLIAPPVVTKLGTVIEPMDEGELIQRESFNKI